LHVPHSGGGRRKISQVSLTSLQDQSAMELRAGDEITIVPSDLVAGGDAITRIDGFPVFTSGIYPGDVARVRLVEVRKGFARAELVELVEPGNERRAAPCPIAGECGGCDWTSLRLDRQLAAKRRILLESLRRIGKFDPASLPAIRVHPSPLNYRLRSRLHSDGERFGFYARGSNRVVPLVPECEIVGPEIIASLSELQAAAAEIAGPAGAAWSGPPTEPSAVGTAEHAERRPAARSIQVWEIGSTLHVTTPGHAVDLEVRVGSFRYALSTASFFQINRHLLATLLSLLETSVASMRKRRTAVDLYAGVGFFTLPLARLFERVTSVEGAAESHRLARKNAERHANIEVVGSAVEEYVRRMNRVDLIFVDPPRAGMQKRVVDAIADHGRERVCYLSCDPVTFARDASRLTARGWRLRSLDLVDLFPNTHHIETFSSFERAG
jgi:23S rRNA (uracil1939-C5)-methyltransferase